MRLSQSDAWIVAASATLLLFYAGVVCKESCAFAQRHKHTSFKSTPRQWYHALKGWVARRRGAPQRSHEGEDDLVERYVTMHLDRQVSREVRRLLMYMGFVCAINSIYVPMSILTGSARWNTLAVDLQTIVSFAIILMLLTFPRLLSPRSMSFWYSVFMVTMVVKLWLDSTPIQLFYRTAGLFPLRYLVSVHIRKVFLVVCWQALYVSASSYRYVALCREVQSEITVHQYVQFECTLVFFTVLLGYMEEGSSRMKYRQEAMSATMSGEQTAMWTMLELICDVVVELDAKLRLKGKLERFSALVNLNRSSKSLKGMQLQDFMPLDEDKKRLEDCLVGEGEAPDARDRPPDFRPGLIHAKLRDALDNHVNVEIFYTRYDRLGIPCFYAGIREHSDISSIPALRTFETARVRSTGGGDRTKMGLQGTPATASKCDLVSPESPAESESGSSSSHGGRRRHGPVAIHRPTYEAGMVLSLINFLEQWVVAEPEEPCCVYHATVAACLQTAEKISKSACVPAFRAQDPNFQCATCGLLSHARKRCETCDARVFPFDATLPLEGGRYSGAYDPCGDPLR